MGVKKGRLDYSFLLSVIPEGRENARKMRNTADMLNMSERELRRAIMNARKSGEIIASCNNGYYIPTTKEELQEYYNLAQRRQKSTAVSIAPVRRRLKEMEQKNEC